MGVLCNVQMEDTVTEPHKIETPDDRLAEQELKAWADEPPYTASLHEVLDRFNDPNPTLYVEAGDQATIEFRKDHLVTLTWKRS